MGNPSPVPARIDGGLIATWSDRARRVIRLATVCALGIPLWGCGGSSAVTGPPGGHPVTLDDRIAAANATAASESNACTPIRPFYWEVGDLSGPRGSGSVAGGVGDPTYTATTLMPIASASKWLYGAYVVQLRRGALSESDITFLTFQSGFTRFTGCLPSQSVNECVAFANNGVHVPANDGVFSYGGGHMEKHASLVGLGDARNADLATALRSQLGGDLTPLVYSQPQLAGGVVTNAETYARFLRAILSGDLQMHDALGTHPVCTNPATCPNARNAPIPRSESYHYSIGHWVEDDPVDGDGAFSSAGAFGFYPWIDAQKEWYGIIARRDTSGSSDPGNPDASGHGFASARCGQLIRAAWIRGNVK